MKKILETVLLYTIAIVSTPIYFLVQVVYQLAVSVKLIMINTVTWPNDVVWNYNVLRWWKQATTKERKEYLEQFNLPSEHVEETLKRWGNEKDSK